MKSDLTPEFESISISLLRDYLLLHGWEKISGQATGEQRTPGGAVPFFLATRKPSQRPELYQLQAQSGTAIELALPTKSDIPSYTKDLQDAITTISEIEGRSAQQIIVDIHSVGFDIIRNRIPISRADRGTIGLEVAAEYIKKTKDLLSAAATTEMEPSSSFKRTLKEALLFSDRCRFGHTFKGSFGFTIESAVPPNLTPTLFPEDETLPFERRVIRRLVRGLVLAQRAVEEDNLEPLVESSELALSANGYDFAAELIDVTPQKDIAFDFIFSPTWKEGQQASDSVSIELNSVHANAFRSAAKRMRLPEVDTAAQVSGLITDLSLKNPSSLDDTRNKRRIVILWASEEFGDIRVAINVSAETYRQALTLHRESRPITVAGTLRRVGRNWQLTVPNNDLNGTDATDIT